LSASQRHEGLNPEVFLLNPDLEEEEKDEDVV
jgi:hypothetical protein